MSGVTYFSLSQQKLYRMLDANLDRAREGLRVVEEWCRFGLENQSLAAQCKHLRQELAQWHSPLFRLARDTAHDPGTQLTHTGEEQRSDIHAVVQANLARTQEALRVLEEYGKLHDSRFAATMKSLRYQVYILDTQLTPTPIRSTLGAALLYLVTQPSPTLIDQVRQSLEGGLQLVQFRQKTGDDRERISLAQELCTLCHHHQALFIVNDRVDIALAVGADGVHLGQQDMSVIQARKILGHQAIIGLSTTSPAELQIALEQCPDYVGVGPVYATPTKPGKTPAGRAYVSYAAQHCPIPWFAIGGIDPQNLDEVLAMGAKRVAVVRSIMQAADPKLLTQSMISQLQQNSPKFVPNSG